MRYFTFGHGVGSGGSVAIMNGLPGVTDMNYAKILFETGFCGSFGFVLVMLFTLARAFEYFKYYSCEISIICFVLCACFFSNSLCLYHLYIIPFWYAIGRIWNESFLLNAQKLNMRI
jgi:hypothetical protein